MVRGESQPHGRTGITLAVGIDVVAQRGDAGSLLRHVDHQVVHFPRIAGVERPLLEEVGLLGLGEHEKIGLRPPEPPDGGVPELHGHEHGHVAAETVDMMFPQPEFHRFSLRIPHCGVGIVELGRIGPVPRHGGTPLVVVDVEIGVLRNPTGIARGMIGHPVQQHLHAEPVRLGHERVEILQSPQLGVDGAVIANRIVRPQRPLAAILADGTDGHEPHGVDAQVAQKSEPGGRRTQRTLVRELAHVHFIKDGTVTPIGMQH